MSTTIENTFLEAAKTGFEKIKKEKFEQWRSEMENEITYRFLFTNVYSVENISKNEKPKYKLTDLGGLHDIDGYETIGDFLENFNGNTKWNDDYGFETYYIELKQQWVNLLVEELNEHLNSVGVKEKSATDLTDESFKELLVDTIENFWETWMGKSFKEVIDANVDSIWEEDTEISMEVDMSNQEEDRRFEQFKPLALDWIGHLVKKGHFIKMDEEVQPLNTSDTDIIKELQEWARNKNYDDLTLFDEFYPKSAKLAKFKWLDKTIYKEKKKEKDEVKRSISSLFSSKGLTIKENIISPNIKNLYALRKNVFDLKGEKEVVIHTQSETYNFYLDKYNRVDGVAEGINKFVDTLEKALGEIASIIIRQVTEDMYKPKNKDLLPTKVNKKIKQIPICNMYGALLYEGYYRGLPADEMYNIYTRDPQTGEFLGEPEGLRFLNWNVAKWHE